MNSNEIEQKGLKSLRNYGIIFAVLAVALIVSGSFLIAKPFNEFSKRLSWKQTEGEIFGFEKVLTDQKISEQNFIAIVDFSFGKDNFIEVKSDPQKELPVINNKVKVFYDEKDPQGAVIGEYSFVKLIPFLVLLILGVISAVLSFISFRKMKDLKKQKNEAQNQTNNSAFIQNFTHNNKVQKIMRILFTDGSASPNPGAGGFAIIENGKPIALGAENPSTNIRMEGLALKKAFEILDGEEAEILTDSEFWVNVLTKWAPAWHKNGWKKKTGEIKNLDIVKPLFELYKNSNVELKWLKGHAGHEFNEMADEWANRARNGETL